ncbi:MAG: HigA family addiction module antitoxin [Gemmatimonadales bacterium]
MIELPLCDRPERLRAGLPSGPGRRPVEDVLAARIAEAPYHGSLDNASRDGPQSEAARGGGDRLRRMRRRVCYECRYNDCCASLVRLARKGSIMPRLPTNRPPTHPGEILLRDFLEPLGLTQSELARHIGVSFPRLTEVVHGKRSVTTDTALRLSRALGTTPDFWLNLQRDRDLWDLERQERETYQAIKPLTVA